MVDLEGPAMTSRPGAVVPRHQARDRALGLDRAAMRTLTCEPARNQPRPGVWSISIRLWTIASRLLGLKPRGTDSSGEPLTGP